MQLPPELAEKLLLETPIQDLSSLCYSFVLYQDICLSPRFWQKRLDSPFSLEKLINTREFTLEDWILLEKRIEESQEEFEREEEELAEGYKLVFYLTGSLEERKSLESSGVDYTLYQLLLPQAERIEKEYRYALGKREFYMEEFERRRRIIDLEQYRLYDKLSNSIQSAFPFLKLFYKEKKPYYSLREGEKGKGKESPLSEKEIRELLFRLIFFKLDYHLLY